MSRYKKNPELNRVLVTGGAGYVGAVLVPKLLEAGYKVTVLDLYMYGEDVLKECRSNPGLREVKGDIRDGEVVKQALNGCDSVIHLACISNDPSFELNPELGRSINLDSFVPLVRASKSVGVKRFVYASSSSVYGVKEGVEVTEDLSLEPLTDYSKFKAECEALLEKEKAPGFVTVTIRPATVCGYSPRQRLDVVVNILTNLGYHKGEISVFGGSQLRPNIHIEDMTDAYLLLLAAPDRPSTARSSTPATRTIRSCSSPRWSSAMSENTPSSRFGRPTICAPIMSRRRRSKTSSASRRAIRSRTPSSTSSRPSRRASCPIRSRIRATSTSR